jgi:hypothetical protein
VLTAVTAHRGYPAEVVPLEITDVGQTGTAGMRATSWELSGLSAGQHGVGEDDDVVWLVAGDL